MDSAVRERIILDSLVEKGAISVADLSRNLEVSEVTIRSDLNSLEKRGFLRRVHGGAAPAIHPHVLERQNLGLEEKQNIAREAASLVRDGDTIMVEAGTTTALVCRYLGDKRDIHVITNSMLAFNNARNNPFLKITLCGGDFRSSTESFVGPIAEETIGRFNVSFAFVGTDGFSSQQGITTHLLEGGEIIKVMKKQARQTVLLADSSKYNQVGPVTIMSLSGADRIITDAGLPRKAALEMREDKRILDIKEDRDAILVKFEITLKLA